MLSPTLNPATHLPPSPGAQFNFAQHLIELNALRPHKAAYIDDAGTLSYAQLSERLRRLGRLRALPRRGRGRRLRDLPQAGLAEAQLGDQGASPLVHVLSGLERHERHRHAPEPGMDERRERLAPE